MCEYTGAATSAAPRLDLGHETQQLPPVVALRKTLAVHDIPADQLLGRIQETVGGHQVDARMMIPPRQQCLQHTGGRGLADGDRSGDTDHERHLMVRVLLPPEERRGRGEQSLPGRDLEVDQPRQRQVHLGDLREIDLLAEAAQADQFVFREHQWRRLAQRPPLLAVELDVRARLAQTCHRHDPSAASEPAAQPGSGLRRRKSMHRIVRVATGGVSARGGPGSKCPATSRRRVSG